MRRVVTIALLALLSISVKASPQAPAAAATGSIEGFVLRSDNGAAVAGAQVTLTFAPLATPGTPLALAGGVAEGGTLGGVLVALPTGGLATVTTTPAAQTLAQAAAARPTIQPVVTGADGKFTFKDVAAGGYRRERLFRSRRTPIPTWM